MRPPEPFRRFALDLAAASGDFILPHFGRPGLEVDLKSDATPVTAADRGAEALMRNLIGRQFPDHGVIGEEYGSDRPDAEWVWVLDPIDGTKSFMTACPLFGTLIALLHGGQPVLGIIHQPVLRQLMVGDGEVTTLNDRPVRVRPCASIESATLLASDLLSPEQHQDGPAFQAFARRARLVRTWGDCYGYLLVASGWADIMVDPIMSPWDLAALVPVIRGAGGFITDWHGGPAYPAQSAVAAGPALHPQVIAALRPAAAVPAVSA